MGLPLHADTTNADCELGDYTNVRRETGLEWYTYSLSVIRAITHRSR